MIDTDFSGKVVLVTGAAQGIGAAIAQAFKEAGAIPWLADIDQQGVEAAARTIDGAWTALDLSNTDATNAMVRDVLANHERIDVLVHAAGGVRGQVGKPVEDVSFEEWRAIFAANVDAAFCLARAVAPAMKRRGRGRIVTISSGAGLRPSLTGIQAYAAAKHALVGLTRQLSHELGPHGITVNSIAPGLVLSNPTTQKQWDSYSSDVQDEIIAHTHTRRLGEAGDIAAAALYFASDSAGWVSGQVLSVDGGRD
jgi:3-oxoacyl-[acyl-carrier protein] reductase